MANYSGVILSGGILAVSTGDTAIDTLIYDWGLMSVAGGNAEKTIIFAGGDEIVGSGGIAGKTLATGASASQLIESGGAAFETILVSGAVQLVRSGGLAWETTVSGAVQWLEISGMAQYTYIGGGGIQDVAGIASCTAVESGGLQNVRSGGAAEDIVVSSGGKLNVAASATVIRAILNEGAMLGYDFHAEFDATSCGGKITTIASRSCDFEILSGTVNTVSRNYLSLRAGVYGGGRMLVMAGGTASGTVAHGSGYIMVSSGGTIRDAILGSAGIIVTSEWMIFQLNTAPHLYVDGEAHGTSVSSGYMEVGKNGVAYGTKILLGYLFMSGSAYDTVIDGCGYMDSCAPVYRTVISSWGVHVAAAAAYDTTIYGGRQRVINGAAAYHTIICGGWQCVSSGALAEATDIRSGGQTIYSGGVASGTEVHAGTQYVYSGGTAVKTVISSGGAQEVSSGGSAVETLIASGGLLLVSSGGRAYGVDAASGSVISYDFGTSISGTSGGAVFSNSVKESRDFVAFVQYVHWGYNAARITVYGEQWVAAGGYAADVTLASVSHCYQIVYGLVERTTLTNNSEQMVMQEAEAIDTVVKSGGLQTLMYGSKADGITVMHGGTVVVSSHMYRALTYISGTVRIGGTMQLVTDFDVNASGCRIFIDLNQISTGGFTVAVDKADLLIGAEWNVDASGAAGVYNLFSGGSKVADGQCGDITIYQSETVIGQLSGDRSFTVGDLKYRLEQCNTFGNATTVLRVSTNYREFSGSIFEGNAYLSLANATVSQLVTGVSEDVTGNATGNIELVDSNTCNIYGGGNNVNVGGAISLMLNGSGVYSGQIYGGSRADSRNVSTGDITITVTDITQTDNVKMLESGQTAWLIGGGNASGGNLTAGSVTVSADCVRLGQIVGGAQAQGAGSTSVVAATRIDVSNAVISGDVFGGGYAYDYGTSIVSGDAELYFNSGRDGITVRGDIYGGGANPSHPSLGGSSIVEGDTTIVFSGNGALLSVGNVSGDGKVAGSVKGTKTLNFTDFLGEFSANLSNFDIIGFSGSTCMTYCGGFTSQNFAFDLADRDLDALFADGFTFGEGDKLLKIELGGQSGTFDLMTCSEPDSLAGMKIELYKYGAVYADFEFGESEKGFTVAVNNGILSLIG